MMRSLAQWQAHPQGQAVAAEPLVAFDAVAAAAAAGRDWRWSAARPLAGLRVLDLTRVLAGPVATRFLAGYGAEVLRIDPPGWNEPGVIPEVTPGKRCARLDLQRPADRAVFDRLLAGADLLVHGYRPGALDRLGYDSAALRQRHPQLITVALDAYGWTGPLAGRRGFDSLVQMSCGIAHHGMQARQAAQPVPLPVQALDHATGYLMAAAAVRALIARLADGGTWHARLSLARTAALLAAAPVPAEPQPALAPPGDDDFATALEQTAWGPARRYRPPVSVEGVPMSWTRPAGSLGASLPAWD
jgi:crotonobetainyl-CoA:carnitine CoA-transferase CaiB-like acyl-CoA transferase